MSQPTTTARSAGIDTRGPASASTAYVFPGLGLQRAGMGTECRVRSKRARQVWRAADEVCSDRLGFSLQDVIDRDPTTIQTSSGRLAHPAGVLQVPCLSILVTLVDASARVAELREHGLFDEDSLFCGHSVGEYSAMTAVTGILKFADLVQIVWYAGIEMVAAVPRDAAGRTAYAMGVLRPHRVGLDETGAMALVATAAATSGQPLEIVNRNIRGRLYTITGHVAAIAELERQIAALKARAAASDRDVAWQILAGVDVPFHSRLLLPMVARFRAFVDSVIPSHVNPDRVLGRLIPNLLPVPLSLERAYVEQLAALTASPLLRRELDHWEVAHLAPRRLARQMIVELFAQQFASPVGWVDTAEFLLGASGVDRIIEIGPEGRAVLVSMLRAGHASQSGGHRKVRIAHVLDVLNARDSQESPGSEE